MSISTLLLPRKAGVFTFDYLKEGSIFCFIPTGFSEQYASAGAALQKKQSVFCWLLPFTFFARAGVQSSMMSSGEPPRSSQHRPQRRGDTRPHWEDREKEGTLPSVCYHLLLLRQHFEALRSDGQLCAHGAHARARTGTLLRTRTCCLYVLFWENPFSCCRTEYWSKYTLSLFPDLENYMFLKQGQRTASCSTQD